VTSFKPRQIVESIEVLTEPERRRRRSVQEKVAIVQETLEPGATVSAVARRHGVNPNQVFAWRKQYQDGSLAAVKAGEAVVPVSQLATAMKEIRELQRLLGKKTQEAEILKEAVEYGRSKNVWAAPILQAGFSDETVCVNVSGFSRVSCFWQQGHDGICTLGSQ
jgi:transposase